MPGVVELEYGPIHSRIFAHPVHHPDLLRFIDAATCVSVPGHEFSESYRSRKWDGLHHFISQGGRFPTGLLTRVLSICEDHGYTPAFTNSGPPVVLAPATPVSLDGMAPFTPDSKWWFQWEAVQAAFSGGLRGVLKVATGGGKTSIAAAIIKSAPGMRVLFLVDSIDLLDQTAERFEALLGEPVGRIGGGDHGDRLDANTRVCVSTVQTLQSVDPQSPFKTVINVALDSEILEAADLSHAFALAGSKKMTKKQEEQFWQNILNNLLSQGKLSCEEVSAIQRGLTRPVWNKRDIREFPAREWLSRVDLLFLDECHLSSSDSFVEVVHGFRSNHVVGLSATPFSRGDLNTLKLLSLCGETLVDIGGKRLVDLGILAEPRIYMVAHDGEVDEAEVKSNSNLSYAKSVDKFLIFNPRRLQAVLDIVRDREKVLILVSSKEKHGPALKELLRREFPNRNVVYLSGDSSRSERSSGRHQFCAGDIDILIATRIFQKGVDIPNIRTLVLAGGGLSTVNTLQGLGRGLRTTYGKTSVEVFDFFDTACQYLVEHTMQRYDDYLGEGYTVSVITDIPPLTSV